MRQIGQLADEASARTFGDYLYVQGIENQVEPQKGEGWVVWINDEDKIPQAAALLQTFRENPADPKYRAKAKEAVARREAEDKDQANYEKKIRNRRQLFRPLTEYGFGPLTFILIVFSVVVAILSNLGDKPEALLPFFITDVNLRGGNYEWLPGLPTALTGQYWRLITPIFIHFGPLHLIFNMLWLRDLGSMIEGRQTTWHLLALVIIIAAGSNVAQFYYWRTSLWAHCANFWRHVRRCLCSSSGLHLDSGAVRSPPQACAYLHPSTVTMMIIYFFACFTPLLPRVANGAHGAGFAMGIVWGYLSSLRHR